MSHTLLLLVYVFAERVFEVIDWDPLPLERPPNIRVFGTCDRHREVHRQLVACQNFQPIAERDTRRPI